MDPAQAATAIQTAWRGFLVRRTIGRAKNYLENEMLTQERGVPLRLLPYLRRDLRGQSAAAVRGGERVRGAGGREAVARHHSEEVELAAPQVKHRVRADAQQRRAL